MSTYYEPNTVFHLQDTILEERGCLTSENFTLVQKGSKKLNNYNFVDCYKFYEENRHDAVLDDDGK